MSPSKIGIYQIEAVPYQRLIAREAIRRKQNSKIMHSSQKHIFSRRENDQRHFVGLPSFIACHSNY